MVTMIMSLNISDIPFRARNIRPTMFRRRYSRVATTVATGSLWVIVYANPIVDASAAVKHADAIILPVAITVPFAIVIVVLESSRVADTEETKIFCCPYAKTPRLPTTAGLAWQVCF